jgi:iron-sulfur cluster repair protein YtfE (RIC family)
LIEVPQVTEHVDPVAPRPRTVQGLLAREHALLRRHLRQLRYIAETMMKEQPLALRDRLDAVLSFLHDDTLPHMEMEETIIYAAVDRLPNGPHSGQAMALDHQAIRALVHEVDRLTSGQTSKKTAAKLQGALFALEAVTRLHIDKEERLYTPLLNQLSPRVRAAIRAELRERS